MRFALMLVVAAVLAGAASAQEIIQLKSDRTPEQRVAAFDAADANKDGKLDLAEFKRAMDPNILAQLPDEAVVRLRDTRDTNNDGFIDRAEFLSAAKVQLHQ